MFITFEGLDGSGKTTQIKLLYDYLHGIGLKVLMVREPGGTEFSERIRKVLFETEEEIYWESQVLSFACARAQLVNNIIRPWVEEGGVVLSDRFIHSSCAYQGYSKASTDAVYEINNIAIKGMYPDLVLFMDVQPEYAFERCDDQDKERFSLSRMNSIYDRYMDIFSNDPDRWFMVPDMSIGGMHKEIKEEVVDHLSISGYI